MITAILIISLLFFVYIGVRLHFTFQFRRQVKKLFSARYNGPVKRFSYAQLEGLPEPAKRYFKHILIDNQPYIQYARITHEGHFKTGFDKKWINIKGEQYATTQTPGFIWKGITPFFTARDMYIQGKGRLIVSLLSVYNIVDGSGETYNQAELQRWLGESVMYPTNLLPGNNLHWQAIDQTTARFTYDYQGLSLYFIVSFNDAGEITQLETKRYIDVKNQATWIIKMGVYKSINNIRVPTKFDVIWRLEKGDFSYARFNIMQIEYDKPFIF